MFFPESCQELPLRLLVIMPNHRSVLTFHVVIYTSVVRIEVLRNGERTCDKMKM
jgi:hypothetical protein